MTMVETPSVFPHEDLVARLAAAIQRHRLATVASGLVPEPHDRELWAALARNTVAAGPPRRQPTTLDDMFGIGLWSVTDGDGAA